MLILPIPLIHFQTKDTIRIMSKKGGDEDV